MVTIVRQRRRRRCKHCERLFIPTTRKQVYCCNAHRVADHRKRRAEAALETKFDRIITQTNLGILRNRIRANR